LAFLGKPIKIIKQTIDLISEIKYSQAYSFKYSIRPGTPAGAFYDHVGEKIKNTRLQEVQEILRDQQMEFNKKFVNSTLKVLVLRNGKKKGSIWEGHLTINRFILIQSIQI
jgi:tRNA-2-methylthio-N6-dimethylallyladenosine synthase